MNQRPPGWKPRVDKAWHADSEPLWQAYNFCRHRQRTLTHTHTQAGHANTVFQNQQKIKDAINFFTAFHHFQKIMSLAGFKVYIGFDR